MFARKKKQRKLRIIKGDRGTMNKEFIRYLTRRKTTFTAILDCYKTVTAVYWQEPILIIGTKIKQKSQKDKEYRF